MSLLLEAIRRSERVAQNTQADAENLTSASREAPSTQATAEQGAAGAGVRLLIAGITRPALRGGVWLVLLLVTLAGAVGVFFYGENLLAFFLPGDIASPVSNVPTDIPRQMAGHPATAEPGPVTPPDEHRSGTKENLSASADKSAEPSSAVTNTGAAAQSAAPRPAAEAVAAKNITLADSGPILHLDTSISRERRLRASKAASTRQPATSRAPLPSRGPANTGSATEDAAQLAYHAASQGDAATAERLYVEAIRRDPTRRDALLGLARLHASAGHTAEAARYFEAALAIDSRDPDAIAGLAFLRGKADPVAWEARIKSALSERGEHALLHLALGWVLGEQKRWGEAVQSFSRALALNSNDGYAWFNLAVALEHSGSLGAAAEAYQRAMLAPEPLASRAKRRLSEIETLRKARQ